MLRSMNEVYIALVIPCMRSTRATSFATAWKHSTIETRARAKFQLAGLQHSFTVD